jgi:hypothetical protein
MRSTESAPTIEPNQHVEAAESSKRRRDPRLPGETQLDGLKKGDPLFGGLETSHCRQQYGCHECHAADPKNDRKDVNSSSDRYIIHSATAARAVAGRARIRRTGGERRSLRATIERARRGALIGATGRGLNSSSRLPSLTLPRGMPFSLRSERRSRALRAGSPCRRPGGTSPGSSSNP